MSGGLFSAFRRGKALELETDVVVVGSGAGGAVAACTFAEAGRQVLVLEEGPALPALQAGAMRQSEHLRHAWREGGMTLAVGLGDSPSINVTAGRVVGGSSTLTGGVSFRIPDHVLEHWSKELGLAGLSSAAMAPYFEQVERDVHVEEVPVELRSRSTVLFGLGSAQHGAPLKPMRRNTRGCDGCGRCNFQCPHGAKMSVDLTYLPRAVARGATVYSDVLVEKVLFEGTRAVGVEGRLLDGAYGAPGSSLRVRARQVVLAAGAMYTPLILWRSGFSRVKPLGRHLSLHPSFRVMGLFDAPVRGWEGALQSAYSDAFEASDGLLFNSAFVPNGVLAGTTPGFGPEFYARTQGLNRLSLFGGMIHDDAGGRLWKVPGREPLMTYRMSPRDRARIPKLLKLMGDIYFSAGAQQVILPIFGQSPLTPEGFRALDLTRLKASRLEVSSQHPLGTAQMGREAATSVVDEAGAVWGTQGLHVACGSIMPSSLGVNPQVAIMAMALRVSSQLLG